MFAQKLERGRGVFDPFRLVKSFVEIDRLVTVGSSQLDVTLQAPAQVRTQCDKPVRPVPVSNTADVVVDAEDLLKHDDAWSIPTRGQGQVAVELVAIEGFDCWHRVS